MEPKVKCLLKRKKENMLFFLYKYLYLSACFHICASQCKDRARLKCHIALPIYLRIAHFGMWANGVHAQLILKFQPLQNSTNRIHYDLFVFSSCKIHSKINQSGKWEWNIAYCLACSFSNDNSTICHPAVITLLKGPLGVM